MAANKNKNLITKEGKKALEKELKVLITEKRPAIIKQIQAAREQGDLSENADYDAAKNAQAQLEARIKEIQSTLERLELIDDKEFSKRVSVGSVISLLDLTSNKKFECKIVGSIETDPLEGKISNECPLAKCIMGHKAGDEVNVKGIETPYKVRILEVIN